ncbi:hybrid sensor histidine kinase/response regulator [Plebeiibacterium sediminum]|uniref:histidine kinase n=1 Tax=Plebeiibacterium sediminum TaxID=2992112 RepID=A0AAE3M6H6_9BACT|nr:hybrid sensor histidine kinase/response regulator [Plebeiobacterium sediminum]MCW3787480.1 hybrid sensor histidine kinase/response regulator [Plebeiobacterium sediminum]
MDDGFFYNILIVDDNLKNVQVLGSLLERERYHTEFALSGQDALNWIEERVFDLVLLDIMMPGMDGFEVCSIIRENRKYDDVPILFVSAKKDTYSTLKAFGVKAQDYITKPFNHDELIARIKTQLELKSNKAKLKTINFQLEEKVKERTEELDDLLEKYRTANKMLEKANMDLKQLDDAKNNFLQLISHEIRTPLNGIVGSVEILKGLVQDEDLLLSINVLDISVKRLHQFSLDAILLTSLNLNKYKTVYSEVDLLNSIEDVIQGVKKRFYLKNIEINLEGFIYGQKIYSDKKLFYEVLSRLIENAVVFSGDNPIIQVSIKMIANEFSLNIIDNGIGFPEEMLENKPSLLSPSESHVDQNIGLDLFLVNKIVEYLEGKFSYGNLKTGGAYVNVNFDNIVFE